MCEDKFEFDNPRRNPQILAAPHLMLLMETIKNNVIETTEQLETKRSDRTLAKRERDGKYYQKSISVSV